MTVTKQITVWCEGDGCGHWDQISSHSTARARRELKRIGWVRQQGKDLCPKCAKGVVKSSP